MDYKKAGVDVEAGQEAVNRIKKAVESSHNANVLSGLGQFAGFFRINKDSWKEPVLVSSTDGVGTKIIVAKLANNYKSIGIDLVNHCVNDIFVHNAAPLFFLDYIGTGKLDPQKVEEVILGMVIACNNHDIALIGGEMAEMPGVYKKEDMDLVGTIVGCTDKDSVINGGNISAGDVVIGFSSSGLHTNGYTLARHILFDKLGLSVDSYVEEIGNTVGEELLTPHKSYYALLNKVINGDENKEGLQVKGMAHITGGGIKGNLKRIIPDKLCAEIDCDTWEPNPIFSYIEKKGDIDRKEMFTAFNMGIGFVVVAPEESVSVLVDDCEGKIIGRIKENNIDRQKVRLLNL